MALDFVSKSVIIIVICKALYTYTVGCNYVWTNIWVWLYCLKPVIRLQFTSNNNVLKNKYFTIGVWTCYGYFEGVCIWKYTLSTYTNSIYYARDTLKLLSIVETAWCIQVAPLGRFLNKEETVCGMLSHCSLYGQLCCICRKV